MLSIIDLENIYLFNLKIDQDILQEACFSAPALSLTWKRYGSVMNHQKNVNFTENSAAKGDYICIEIDTQKALKSWHKSVFSFQWLTPEGDIKAATDLAPEEQEKRTVVESALQNGGALQKPVLGIGLQDNIEIGSGRAEFLTLIAHGHRALSVHIPKSNAPDFEKFLFKI